MLTHNWQGFYCRRCQSPRYCQMPGVSLLCRLSHHPGQLLGQLSRQLEPHVHSLDTKQLTLVAWSLAKLGSTGSHEGALLDAVATAGIQQADQFTPLVRRACGGSFLEDFDITAISIIHIIYAPHLTSSSQGMANLIWSFGRLHHPADALVAAIVPQARLSAAQLPAATGPWAVLLAHSPIVQLHCRLVIQVPVRRLAVQSTLNKLPCDAMQAAHSIEEFNAHCLCSLLYGLAVLQQPLGHELKAALPSAVVKRCGNTSKHSVAAHSAAARVEACVSEPTVCCRVEEFTPQGLALSMWALSGLQVCTPLCTRMPACTHHLCQCCRFWALPSEVICLCACRLRGNAMWMSTYWTASQSGRWCWQQISTPWTPATCWFGHTSTNYCYTHAESTPEEPELRACVNEL
jgi:hypothetical protein